MQRGLCSYLGGPGSYRAANLCVPPGVCGRTSNLPSAVAAAANPAAIATAARVASTAAESSARQPATLSAAAIATTLTTHLTASL